MKRRLALLAAICLLLPLLLTVVHAEGDPTTVTDELTYESIGVTGTSYKAWYGKAGNSGAEYDGNTAGIHESVALRTKNNSSGIVTRYSGGNVRSVAITWNENTASGGTLRIYGKNEDSYEDATNLYNAEKRGTLLGTVVCGSSTELTVTGDYAYIGMRSASGDIYIDKIEITWETATADPTEQPTPTATASSEPTSTPTPADTQTFSLVTAESDLAAGDTVILVGYDDDGNGYAMGAQKTYNRTAVAISDAFESTYTFSADRLATASDDTEHIRTFTLGRETGGWTFRDTVQNGYLYAESSSADHLKTIGAVNENAQFAIEIGSGGAATLTAQGTNSHNLLQFHETNHIFSCYETDEHTCVYLYKRTEASAPQATPVFKTQSLVLSGQIGVNFYLDLSMLTAEERASSYMTFSIDDRGTITPRDNFDPDCVNRSEIYYGFTCYINAIQMADEITATLHYSQNGEAKTLTQRFRAEEYFTTFDRMVQNGECTDPYMIALTHALADYGHYVQLFLASVKDWTLGTDYQAMNGHYTESYPLDDIQTAVAKEAIELQNEGSDLEAMSYSVTLDSETKINLYLKPVASYSGAVSVTVDGQTAFAPTQLSDGRYVVRIADISAHRLAERHTVVATTEHGMFSITLSVLSYVNGIFEAYPNDTAAQNAAASLYAYANAATAYQQAQSAGE